LEGLQKLVEFFTRNLRTVSIYLRLLPGWIPATIQHLLLDVLDRVGLGRVIEEFVPDLVLRRLRRLHGGLVP